MLAPAARALCTHLCDAACRRSEMQRPGPCVFLASDWCGRMDSARGKAAPRRASGSREIVREKHGAPSGALLRPPSRPPGLCACPSVMRPACGARRSGRDDARFHLELVRKKRPCLRKTAFSFPAACAGVRARGRHGFGRLRAALCAHAFKTIEAAPGARNRVLPHSLSERRTAKPPRKSPLSPLPQRRGSALRACRRKTTKKPGGGSPASVSNAFRRSISMAHGPKGAQTKTGATVRPRPS